MARSLLLALVLSGLGALGIPGAPGGVGGRPGLGAPAVARAAGFRDVEGHWAGQAIARMAAKGVVQGVRRADGDYFEPGRPVTRYEAVVMVVRSLGLEDEARARAESGESGGVASAPAWARGHLAVAGERGIVTAAERAAFRGQDGAQRMQVAGWLVRALGLEAEARRATAAPFADLQLVGPEWRGYVAVAADTGLMVGDGRRFRPFDTVTRAELAVLLTRVDRLLDNGLDARDVTGTVTAVGAGEVTLAGAGGERVLPVGTGAFVFFDGAYVRPEVGVSILAPGDRVEAVRDETGGVVYLEARSQVRELEGQVTALLRSGEERVLRVRTAAEESEVRLAADAAILLNGLPAGWSALRQGQGVRVLAQGRSALAVRAESRTEEVRGSVRSVVLLARGAATVVLAVRGGSGEEERTYELPAGLALTRNGELVTAAALAVKDVLTLTLRDGAVVRGRAEAEKRTVTGILKEVRYGDPTVLVLDLSEGTRWAAQDEKRFEAAYALAPTARLRREGLEVGVTALRAGDAVEADLEGDTVVALRAALRTAGIGGTLVSITIAQPATLTVRLLTGQEAVYRVSRDVDVRVGGAQVSLFSLKPGMRVELAVTAGGEVVAVRATEGGLRDDVRGTVRFVDARENRVVLELADGSLRQLRPATGFLVYRDGRLQERVTALRAGDVALAVGRDTPGEPFVAEIVVVLGSAGQ